MRKRASSQCGRRLLPIAMLLVAVACDDGPGRAPSAPDDLAAAAGRTSSDSAGAGGDFASGGLGVPGGSPTWAGTGAAAGRDLRPPLAAAGNAGAGSEPAVGGTGGSAGGGISGPAGAAGSGACTGAELPSACPEGALCCNLQGRILDGSRGCFRWAWLTCAPVCGYGEISSCYTIRRADGSTDYLFLPTLFRGTPELEAMGITFGCSGTTGGPFPECP